jgi:ATP-dependent DNA helicase RecG
LGWRTNSAPASGNLYRYGKIYSGQTPQLIDGDVFHIIVPLDDNYSFDALIGKPQSAKIKGNNCTLNCTLTEKAILEYLADNPAATQKELAAAINRSVRSIKTDMDSLQRQGILVREGARKNGHWIVRIPE